MTATLTHLPVPVLVEIILGRAGALEEDAQHLERQETTSPASVLAKATAKREAAREIRDAVEDALRCGRARERCCTHVCRPRP